MTARRMRGAVVALAAAVLLAGCASIPLTGPVQTAPPAQAEQDDSGTGVVPNRPAPDASPENIVRGFIQAASAGPGYTVAKQFLTGEFAKTWDPGAQILVHTKSWTTAQRGDDRVELDVPLSATVNRAGVFTPSDQNEPLDFQLQRVRGQWRISAGPEGVVLSQTAFLSVFKAVTPTFFDAEWKRLVPDRRWFPGRTGEAPADTIRALITGQAPALREVTRSAFPTSTRLRRPVRSSEGQVLVDLGVPGAQPDRQTTDRMQLQLEASLQVPVRLTVNGRVPPAVSQAQPEQTSATSPLVIARGRFGTLGVSGGVQEDADLGPRIVALRPASVTFSAQQRLAAVLAGDGRVVVVEGDRVLQAGRGASRVAPSLDQRGWTYWVPADDPTSLRAIDKNGNRVDVSDDLGGTPVRAIEVSTDGTRMLVLHETAQGPSEAYVAGILRDGKGVPTGLTTDRFPVDLGTDGAIDATWVDQSTVAVLTTSSSSQSVILQPLGGIANSLGTLLGAREIVGATGQNDLRALLSTGALARLSPNAWSLEFPASTGVDVLAVQR